MSSAGKSAPAVETEVQTRSRTAIKWLIAAAAFAMAILIVDRSLGDGGLWGFFSGS